MALEAGTKLGQYEILAAIGAGGMGEVYRANDTKLGREVAIKVLPEDFARSKDRLARFEREARLLASLNHANIATIHNIEQAAGIQFLVMEYVSGQTLADRLKRGSLPLDEALDLFKQIADALEAAHEKGIIHRDLKPANIKVTPEGKVKVLDFGLAKAFAGGEAALDPEESLTLTQGSTEEGVILGTASYMSPEQARGKPVDKRTDIWSFGCVLYEALTGRKAFKGDTLSDTIVVILQQQPQWEKLPSRVPPRLRNVLNRCLRKELHKRLHDIADLRIEIEDILEKPVSAFDNELPPARRVHPLLLLTLGLVLGASAVVLLFRSPFYGAMAPDVPIRPVRFAIQLPPGEYLSTEGHSSLTLSPEGRRLVYVAEQAGQTVFYQRDLAAIATMRIAGAEGGFNPFFSTDGQWLGFFAKEEGYYSLKRLSFGGGVPVVFHQEANLPYGGARWGPNDRVIFPNALHSGLFEISSDGGTRNELTQLRQDEGESAHRWADVLPEGKAVLFTSWIGDGSFDDAQIVVQNLDTEERQEPKTLVEGGTFARYSPTGHVVYARAGRLLAAPFDANRLEVTGPPVAVLDGLMMNTSTGVAHFTFSDDGTLAYVPGQAWDGGNEFLWVERGGSSRPLAERSFPVGGLFSLSPDGGRLALTLTHNEEEDIWVYDIARDRLTQLTSNGGNYDPIWNPDGDSITYRSVREGGQVLLSRSSDGSDSAKSLETQGDEPVPGSWSVDGTVLAYWSKNAETGFDIWTLDTEGDGEGETERQPFLRSEFNEREPAFSPDGKWLAFVSDESGHDEVYVAPISEPASVLRISEGGGNKPRWSSDGNELFFCGKGDLIVVSLENESELSVGEPEVLLPINSEVAFDITDVADAPHFLMIKEEERPRQINIVINWFEELRRLVPTN